MTPSEATNYFDLFGMPVQFTLDRSFFEKRYLQLMRAAHPDLAGEDDGAQLEAMELAARVNEAYAVLGDDLKRAEYVLKRRGVEAVGVAAGRPGPEEMERVFELREAVSVAETAGDVAGLAAAKREAQRWQEGLMAEVAGALDGGEGDERTAQKLALARYVRGVLKE